MSSTSDGTSKVHNDSTITETNETTNTEPDSSNADTQAPEQKHQKPDDTWGVNAPCAITAVLFKEAALDSPTFRASMNHLDNQMNDVDRWLDSFTRSLSKLSLEMDCKFLIHSNFYWSITDIF